HVAMCVTAVLLALYSSVIVLAAPTADLTSSYEIQSSIVEPNLAASLLDEDIADGNEDGLINPSDEVVYWDSSVRSRSSFLNNLGPPLKQPIHLRQIDHPPFYVCGKHPYFRKC
ncbi:unnamed protein product, partial [Meganyctiphanes norvegica]